MIMQLIIFTLVVAGTWVIAQFVVPFITDKVRIWQEKRTQESAEKLEKMFIKVDKKKLAIMFALSPLLTGIIGLIIFQSFLGLFICAIIGLVLPATWLKNLQTGRYKKFNSQLPDGLMILSSCLKGGLSLLQSIEVMAEEMSTPISQEFGIIVKENKMGISLDESLTRLSHRMPSEDLNLMNTAILVARETGGNLPQVFARLVNTIRSKSQIIETVRTMTLMGRAQGIILSALPFVFSFAIYKTSPQMLEEMFQSEIGRMLLVLAAILQIIGIFLIRIFSRVEV